MPSTEPDPQQESSQRPTQLEELVTHLERTVEDLDQVTLGMQRRLDTLEASLAALTARLEGFQEPGAESRSLEDERPPHY